VNCTRISQGPSRYLQLDAHIGQGTYGKVEKARDLLDQEVIAIKKVKVEQAVLGIGSDKAVAQYGIHFTVLREIKVMRELTHPNIMTIKDVFVDGDFINLVMPYMVTDLRKLLEKRIRLNEAQVKCITLQIVKGIVELHNHWFIHRDLAPANVFISSDGVCKIGDFGLARQFASPRPVNKTPKVVTLWYRAPELIYGAQQYHDRVDVWSIGCIFAELLQGGKPLFPGNGEIDQIGKIFEVCGTPSEINWPGARQLPLFFEFTHNECRNLKDIFPSVPEQAIDLLQKLLALDPLNRISAQEALDHPYFKSLPAPCNPSELPLQFLS